MTKKDFFIVLIKVFGLYSIVTNLFSVLPSSLIYALSEIDAFVIAWLLLVIIGVFGLFILLIFKAHKVVSMLKLDKGFDSNYIDFGNDSAKNIIKIGIIIIGGLLIINNIPSFLSQLFFSFKNEVSGSSVQFNGGYNLAISIINIILGYLLLSNYNFIAKRMKLKDSE